MTSRVRNSLLLAGLAAGATAMVLLRGHIVWTTVCPFKLITGIPCPGCGGLRAAQALMQGDILHALWLNPLSVLLIVWAAVSAVWLAVDILRDSNSYVNLYHRHTPKVLLIIIVAVLVANWIFNIVKGL